MIHITFDTLTNFIIEKADPYLYFGLTYVTRKTTDETFTNNFYTSTDGEVTFSSSDTKVEDVDSSSGLVTFKGAGTATITATASEGECYKAGSLSFQLTIEAPAPTPKPAASGFSDVRDPTHPYYNAIYWVAEQGITKGYSDGTFGINRPCTRGEMMMFVFCQ